MVSFTGSGPVGYAIQEQVPGKHVVLEPEDRLLCFGKLEEMRSMIPERPRRRARVRKLPPEAQNFVDG